MTAEQQIMALTAALGALTGGGGYTRQPMLRVSKEKAWQLYRSIVGVPSGASVGDAAFIGWRTHAIATLGTMFGDDSPLVAEFRAINFHDDVPLAGGGGAEYAAQKFREGCEAAKGIMLAVNQRIEAAPDDPPTSSAPARRAKRSQRRYTCTTMLRVTKAEALANLNAALKGVPKGKDHQSMLYTVWHERTLDDLAKIFGDESNIVRQFKLIKFESNMSTRLSLRDIQQHGRRAARDRADDEDERRNREAFEEGCERAVRTLKDLIEVVNGEPDVPPNPAPSRPATPPPKPPLNQKIFVVHGHDGRLKNAVRAFIKDLGLLPIILHERPDKGRTIIEKFEQESDVGHAVVLATGDDLAASKHELKAKLGGTLADADLTARARQNVVGELMNFVGKIGRENVTLITEPGVDLPSDVQGVIYAARSEWQLKFMVALIDAGYEFTMQQIRDALSIRE